MTVEVRVGPTGNEQESDFMNATLQTHGRVAFSIATHVNIPLGITKIEAVAAHLEYVLGRAALCSSGFIKFEVEVGREDANGEEDEDA